MINEVHYVLYRLFHFNMFYYHIMPTSMLPFGTLNNRTTLLSTIDQQTGAWYIIYLQRE